MEILIQHSQISFNSRPHTEVDATPAGVCSSINFFQLTTSHGGRPDPRDECCPVFLFQLTTSHGGRPPSVPESLPGYPSFNSRPHTEVDELGFFDAFLLIVLSTHDLTRRSTANIYNNLHIFNSIFLLI